MVSTTTAAGKAAAGKPSIPVRQNRTATLRRIFQINNDDLQYLANPPQSESSPAIIGQNRSVAKLTERQVNTWFKHQFYFLERINKNENDVYERYLRIEREKTHVTRSREQIELGSSQYSSDDEVSDIVQLNDRRESCTDDKIKAADDSDVNATDVKVEGAADGKTEDTRGNNKPATVDDTKETSLEAAKPAVQEDKKVAAEKEKTVHLPQITGVNKGENEADRLKSASKALSSSFHDFQQQQQQKQELRHSDTPVSRHSFLASKGLSIDQVKTGKWKGMLVLQRRREDTKREAAKKLQLFSPEEDIAGDGQGPAPKHGPAKLHATPANKPWDHLNQKKSSIAIRQRKILDQPLIPWIRTKSGRIHQAEGMYKRRSFPMPRDHEKEEEKKRRMILREKTRTMQHAQKYNSLCDGLLQLEKWDPMEDIRAARPPEEEEKKETDDRWKAMGSLGVWMQAYKYQDDLIKNMDPNSKEALELTRYVRKRGEAVTEDLPEINLSEALKEEPKEDLKPMTAPAEHAQPKKTKRIRDTLERERSFDSLKDKSVYTKIALLIKDRMESIQEKPKTTQTTKTKFPKLKV